MAYNYEEGGRYYLPVVVDEVDEDADYPVSLCLLDGGGGEYVRIKDKPGLLLTADEINGANITQARDNDKTGYEELKKRYEGVLGNATEMSDEIKVLKSENERLSKQNEELGAKVAELTTWYNEANKTASEAAEANDELKAKVAELRAENDKLKADCNEWKDTADERLVAVQVVAAERDNLKTDNDNLRSQIGKLTTTVQNLASDANFYKTDRDKWLNTAQENAKLVDALQEENKKLKQELEDAGAACDAASETSIKRKNRVTTMEEVIVALVEKIRRLEGDD